VSPRSVTEFPNIGLLRNAVGVQFEPAKGRIGETVGDVAGTLHFSFASNFLPAKCSPMEFRFFAVSPLRRFAVAVTSASGRTGQRANRPTPPSISRMVWRNAVESINGRRRTFQTNETNRTVLLPPQFQFACSGQGPPSVDAGEAGRATCPSPRRTDIFSVRRSVCRSLSPWRPVFRGQSADRWSPAPDARPWPGCCRP